MTQEIKDKWIEELRSGKWKQIYAASFSDVPNEACALGVLGHITDTLFMSKNLGRRNVDYEKLAAIIGPTSSTILALNDAEKLDFPQIAEWIEENVEVTENAGNTKTS